MSEPDTTSNRFAGKVRQAEDPTEKTLRIKVNALKRTIKDLVYAKNEVDRETDRLEKIRSNEPDRVPQQEKVLDEARMMVPHSENRIMSLVKDLSDFLEKESGSVSNDELVELARATILEGQAAVS
ncbi:tubulin binding cofactor A-like protein [Leptomonas pyrrhocoris]|uniref:Tubulin-specific chaperone A n=1 Tax=Leptomonas pyrrhocoris TaxID=157538 RepID=A0A0N0DZ60_LEPPY|nr:tubulin binding cofactor A-like protein [Leptomonas pyrrhocoris]KPA84915.1 tubulin binding cofactor A-like protein [Leptomonas pyrrhocoris]|eukprot:XP_015663354.1 tubulin binding cofactor A-like protein [Leptomonas pyrrhocoris]